MNVGNLFRKVVPITNSEPGAKSFVKDSFVNFAAALGMTQPGGVGNNLASQGTYTQNYLSRVRQLLENIYRTSWVCGVAVDSVSEDMCKRGIEINTSAPPDQLEGLHSAWRDMHLWDQISDTIKWGRLYGGAIGIMLVDGQRFDTPLRPETVGRGAFRGIYPLDRWTAQAVMNMPVRDYGPDFGKPMYYDTMADNNVLPNARIHYSRVLRIDGIDLPYQQRQAENQWGQSIIERIYDRLLAFDSTTEGAAQLVYKAHLRTLSVKDLRTNIGVGGNAMYSNLKKQVDFMRLMQSNEGITLLDAEDKFEAHQYNFAGLDTVLLQFAQQLAGALQIPLTRLFGQSPAGLNSTGESDMRNYYDGIIQQQERRLRGPLSTMLHLTWRSLYGTDLPAGSNFSFRPLWVMSDEQRATIAGTLTTAIVSAETSGTIDRATALKEMRQQSHLTGLWSNISDEQIAEAEEEPPPGALAIAELERENEDSNADEEAEEPGAKSGDAA